MSTFHPRRRALAAVGAFAAATLVLGACTNSSDDDDDTSAAVGKSNTDNDKSGDTVTIGFSAPAADHGWMGAITKAAVAQADEYDDVELKVAEGTNDVNLQISQVETFINDKVDAIVLLPFDGAAMTSVARKAMDAGIVVVNVDREFDSPFAARTTVLGDNYGMGVSAGTFVCEDAAGATDKIVTEIAGIDSLPLTQDRSQGFEDALKSCGLKVSNRVAAEFTVESGEKAAANLLQAAPKIDYLWNHDDDQGVGVLAAINNADRDEFTMIGGAGSADVMEAIKADDTVLKATVVYPSTQAADGVKLARLLVQDKS
ncbi:MAG: substrate-binding domain-containing protein, partial [Aeromicrobium sp.]